MIPIGAAWGFRSEDGFAQAARLSSFLTPSNYSN